MSSAQVRWVGPQVNESLVFHPEKSMWELRWKKWHCYRLLSQYFGFTFAIVNPLVIYIHIHSSTIHAVNYTHWISRSSFRQVTSWYMLTRKCCKIQVQEKWKRCLLLSLQHCLHPKLQAHISASYSPQYLHYYIYSRYYIFSTLYMWILSINTCYTFLCINISLRMAIYLWNV